MVPLTQDSGKTIISMVSVSTTVTHLTEDNLSEDSKMAKESKIGRMEVHMTVNGKKAKCMGMENSSGMMDPSIKDFSRTIKGMARVSSSMKTARYMTVIGGMIKNMARATIIM